VIGLAALVKKTDNRLYGKSAGHRAGEVASWKIRADCARVAAAKTGGIKLTPVLRAAVWMANLMQKITQAHCNRCGHSTNHDIIAAEKQGDSEDVEHGVNWCDLYEMLKCRGCDSVTMRHTFGDEQTDVVYYPPAISRRAPVWTNDILSRVFHLSRSIPASVCALMREIYTAVQNDSRRLAAMGIRAALEQVMIDKVGDKGRFKANVDALQQAGYLSMRQAFDLNSILDAGHATVHRGWEPTNDDIATLLDIAESIIESAYLHENRIRALDRNVPKRPRPSSGEVG
jgi:hypothetical protein